MKSILTTERLALRLFQLRDVDAFYKICQDPDVMRYIGDGHVPSHDEIEQSISRWIRHYDDYGYSLFALEKLDNQQLIGFCGLIRQDINDQTEVELGYRLGKAYWGFGFATEAANAVKKFAVHHCKLSALVSIIQPENFTSIRVAKKLGMTLREELIFHEQPVRVYHFINNDGIL